MNTTALRLLVSSVLLAGLLTGAGGVDPPAAQATTDRPKSQTLKSLRNLRLAVQPQCEPGQSWSAEAGACVDIPRDADRDGSIAIDLGGNDCDDNDANRFPGNFEVCDADGHDEDCDFETGGERDADRDGHVDSQCFNWGPPSGR